ncbi:MAG: DUF3604 domain-containing protein [Candidatus Pacebacteria bacterium]|nr:DUF3604 domain-containing protein [Candidatus Paceibacterota bacterium]
MKLELTGMKSWRVAEKGDITLRLRASLSLPDGARLWLLYDIRQDVSPPQITNRQGDGYIEAHNGRNSRLTVNALRARTLDLYPVVPEFLHVAEFRVAGGPVDDLTIALHNWQGPLRPIDPFRFWLLIDPNGEWEFRPTGYKSYRMFTRPNGERVPFPTLNDHLMAADLAVKGSYPSVPAANVRGTLGVFWGELHGMAFNQRSLDDFYNYAKHVTQLDFAAAMLFSYNTCVGDVWQSVKDAAARHTEPGHFVAFSGFECGTPPEDSHRCAYFPDAGPVPPIFCDSRPPAKDPYLRARFHPDTVVCPTRESFYATVQKYRGFVGGHFHTTTYDRELLAEMWQKQRRSAGEEERLFSLLKQGLRFGLVGGSDTHDSMPGNPDPEPGCPQPAGFTGVWADDLTTESLTEAFHARRVFATSGARIALWFACGDHPMGSILPASVPRRFELRIDAPGEIATVEILRNGHPVRTWSRHTPFRELEHDDPDRSSPDFYLARVTQRDGHRAWSSPVWFTS